MASVSGQGKIMTLYHLTRGVSLAAFLLGCLSGCIPTMVRSMTNKAPDYVDEPKRLFVVESLGNELGALNSGFDQAFRGMIRDCAVETDFFARPPQQPSLALDTRESGLQRAQGEQMRNFRPDMILSLREISYRSRRSSVQQVTYGLEFADVKSKRTVWKAELVLTPGADSDEPLALSREIRDRLRADGILRSCADTKS